MRGLGIPLVLGLTIALSSCATSSESDGAFSTAEAEAARRSITGLWTGSGVLAAAEDQLVKRCMEAAGFTWEALASTDDRALRVDYSADVARARTDGYGLREEVLAARRSVAAEGSPAQLSAAEQEQRQVTLNGPDTATQVSIKTINGGEITTNSRGCRTQAGKDLYGTPEEWLRYTEATDNTVRLEIGKAVSADDTVRDRFEDWRTCMEDLGYRDIRARNYGRAQAMVKYDDLSVDKAFAAERAIAVDDATCDDEVGYTKAARAAEGQAMAGFLRDHEAEVLSWQEIQRAAVQRARAAMAVS